MGASLQDTKRRTIVWDEHAAIAGAIAAGDGARAARLIEQHGMSASGDLAAQLARNRKVTKLQGEKR
jgi:DNA-binding GntR family transcriptional regulator